MQKRLTLDKLIIFLQDILIIAYFSSFCIFLPEIYPFSFDCFAVRLIETQNRTYPMSHCRARSGESRR